MRALKSLFGGLRKPRAAARANACADRASSAAEAESAVPYPRGDPGIPVRSIDDLLAAHDDLIRRTKLSYGADRHTFDRDLLSVIRRYAEYVHLLPATLDQHYSVPGGLLRMGLEIAFYALQGTDGQIFSGHSTISHRRQLEPRWRHATFIAGLCSELHRTLSQVRVTDVQGDEWPAYLTPLNRWLHERAASHFFVRWIPHAQETRALSVFALPQVIASHTLNYLAQDNSVVVPHMMACISGMPVYREHNVLDDLVRRAALLVIDRDLQARPPRYGTPQLGSHLERYLIDALRRLVVSNALWMPNAEKSRVWYAEDGLFMVWPNAASDLHKLLEVDQLPGVPKSPERILAILTGAGVIQPSEGVTATWPIFPPGADKAIEAVRLSSPSILLTAMACPPQPLPYSLTKPAPRSPVASVPVQRHPASVPNAQADLPMAFAPPGDSACVDLKPHPKLFSITAPLRLDARLRAVLGDIVDSLNRDGADAACCSTPRGIFIPLAEFARRAIEPTVAIRALADASMLASPSSKTKPEILDFGGQASAGVVIDRRYTGGFDATNIEATAIEGDKHAAPQV